jgi:2'-5' RNA ligase
MSAARSDNVDATGNRSTVESMGPVGDAIEPDTPMTVGVAISIPQPWAEILDAVRASSGDPLAAFIPAHVTLLGPTDIDPDRIGEAEARLAAAAAAHAPFVVHLRGTGTFRPVTEVVFVAVATGIGECERLATDVRRGPLLRDLHYPYHPHVTIAHDVPTSALDRVYAELAEFEALFTADHFTLYVHGSDGRWRPLRDFKLTGEPETPGYADGGDGSNNGSDRVGGPDGAKETEGVSPPPTP